MLHKNPSSSDSFFLKVCLLAISLVILSVTLDLPGAFEQTDAALAQNGIIFTDVTASVGMGTVAPQWGGIWGDFDSDGDQDLYAGNHFNTPNLYRNDGGTFTDIQPLADTGIKSGPDDWHGAAWGDYNNDGFLDLYVVVGKARDGSDFYINNGDETFMENALAAGVKNDDGRGRVPQWVDYDNDGYLDIFVANDVNAAPHALYHNNDGGGTFTDVAESAEIDFTFGADGVAWADYDNDGWMDFILTKTGSGNPKGFNLFRNRTDQNEPFEDVTDKVGFTSGDGQFPRTAAWGDYDNDGDLDLYLGRSYFPFVDNLISTTNVITAIARVRSGQEGITFNTTGSEVTFDLWQSDRIMQTYQIELGVNNTFPSNVPFTLNGLTNTHIGQPTYTPGAGDSNSFVWRNSQEKPWNLYWNSSGTFDTVSVITTTDGTFTDISADGLDIPPPSQPRPNALYRNKGNGTFKLDTNYVDEYEYNTYNAQWIDFDNDGDLDLYVTNTGDTYLGNQPNQLYQNDNGIFTDVANSVKLDNLTSGNEVCTAWADYNNDGFLDMFLSNSEFTGYLAGSQKLYRNEGNDNHWLQISLIGTESNRLGIGTKIEVTTGDVTQFRQVGVDSSNGCHNSFVAHFGLDQVTTADAITVTWPSGNVDVLEDIPADQILTITENLPTLTMTTPANETTDVSLNQPIVVRFSEQMNTSSVTYIVTPTLPLTPTWSQNDTKLTLAHPSFASNTNYAVKISGQDKGGNSLIASSVPNPWQFTTGTQVSPEADLSISHVRMGMGSITAGDSVTYTLSITNSGPTMPVDAAVVMSFNDATALSAVNGSGCTWMPTSEDINCTVSDISSTLATLNLVVETSPTYNGNLTSLVTVEPAGGAVDPNQENNNDGPVVVTVIKNDTAPSVYLPLVVK